MLATCPTRLACPTYPAYLTYEVRLVRPAYLTITVHDTDADSGG